MIKKYNIYVLFFIVTSHLNFKLCTSTIHSQPKIDEQKDFIQQQLINHFDISLFILALVDSKSYVNIKLHKFINNYYQKFFLENQPIIFTDANELRINVIDKFNESKELIKKNENNIFNKTDWKQYIISQNILMINFLKDEPYDAHYKNNLEKFSSLLEKQNKFLSKNSYFKTIIICIILTGSLGFLYKFPHKKPVKDESKDFVNKKNLLDTIPHNKTAQNEKKDSKKSKNINPLATRNLSNKNIQKLIQQHNQQNNSSIIGG